MMESAYAITRSSSGVAAVREALVDSASSAASQCKFQVTFLLAPDISPVDLVEFQQEVSRNPDLSTYKVSFLSFGKQGTNPQLLTAFQSSCQYAEGPDPYKFAFEVEIRDEGNSPGVANANLLIKQLCSPNHPFLFATLNLKLDDYAEPVHDLCRQHNITEQTYYRWKAKYGGMDSSEVKKLSNWKMRTGS